MLSKEVYINNQKYLLKVGYQDDQKAREEFNDLTYKTWEFTFEDYYNSGYWNDRCIIYSLFKDEKIVSHLTISILETILNGKSQDVIQVGTVMTAEDYRGKGLSRFLMEFVLELFKDKVAGWFLFANETVLDFYPKFGFKPMAEFEHSIKVNNNHIAIPQRKLDLTQKGDLQLFENIVDNSIPNSIFPMKSKELTLFYCYVYADMGYADSIYYIESMDCIAIADYEGDVLSLHEVFSDKIVDMEELLPLLCTQKTSKIRFGFTPLDVSRMESQNYVHEDLCLFVSPSLVDLFTNSRIRVPIMAHT